MRKLLIFCLRPSILFSRRKFCIQQRCVFCERTICTKYWMFAKKMQPR